MDAASGPALVVKDVNGGALDRVAIACLVVDKGFRSKAQKRVDERENAVIMVTKLVRQHGQNERGGDYSEPDGRLPGLQGGNCGNAGAREAVDLTQSLHERARRTRTHVCGVQAFRTLTVAMISVGSERTMRTMESLVTRPAR